MKTCRCYFFITFITAIIAISSCQKGGNNNSNEQNLVVETSPLANGHVEAPSPGPSFPLRVTVKSTMPAAGVKIDITAKPDGGTVSFFTTSTNSSNAVNDFTITGATQGVVSIVDITVTSLSTSSNKWNGNYKFSRK